MEAIKVKKILWELDTGAVQNPPNDQVYEWVIYGYSPQQESFNFGIETYTDDQINIPTTTNVLKTYRFNPNRYRLKSLRMFVDIISIAAVTPFQPTELLPESVINQQQFFHELGFPKFRFELILSNSIQDIKIASFNLQNKRPGYYINLLRYLTENIDFLADSSTQIKGRIRNLGDGMPGISDTISIYGDVEEIGDYT